jgi:hypothetical protein
VRACGVTSQQPISPTTWLTVTPHCNDCNHCARGVFVGGWTREGCGGDARRGAIQVQVGVQDSKACVRVVCLWVGGVGGAAGEMIGGLKGRCEI